MDERVYHTLEPVWNKDSRILILGSFPSVVSRRQNFYYANPSNRFWTVMSVLFDEQIEDRKEFCLKQGIALWDVIASCHIHASDDASITDVRVNDISSLVKKTRIHTVFTTGKKAETLFRRYIRTDLPLIGLPSTSSANARMKLDDLVKEYAVIRKELSHL